MALLPSPASGEDAILLSPVHASTVSLAVNNSDFVFVFSLIKTRFEPSKGLVPGASLEPVSVVSVSPLVAKQFLRQLRKSVEEFEAQVGPLPDFGEISQIEDQGLTLA